MAFDNTVVRIFTNPNIKCKGCDNAKRYLSRLQLHYMELDINSKEYSALSSGESSKIVPVIEVGVDLIYGFSKKKIDEALINNNILNINIPK